jgi:hypothetical protein
MTYAPLPMSAVLEALHTSGFGDRALRDRADPLFEIHEMGYKIRLARAIRSAAQAFENGQPTWSRFMAKAVGSNENNIVPWRLKDTFKKWCEDRQEIAGPAIHKLISGDGTTEQRLLVFERALQTAGITQIGQQVCLASVLLMARDATACPPVRTDVLKESLQALRLEWPVGKASVTERYAMLMVILDALVEFSQDKRPKLADRLEAQGAVWCVISGWMDKVRQPILATQMSSLSADEDISAASAQLESLEHTERAAIIAARRGQGRFRSELIGMWLGCSVTCCQNLALLKASHLKPWRLSNNQERLDPFNGLLLTPNFDALIDQHFISFEDDGTMLVAATLSENARLAFGLSQNMRIEGLKPRHGPYLSSHRSRFRELEAVRSGDVFKALTEV